MIYTYISLSLSLFPLEFLLCGISELWRYIEVSKLVLGIQRTTSLRTSLQKSERWEKASHAGQAIAGLFRFMFSAWPCLQILFVKNVEIVSKMALQKCNVNLSAQIVGWIFWCEFGAVNFLRVNFWGGSSYWKTQDQKIRTQNSAPKFGTQKFASQNSTPNSGSRGAKSPARKLAPEKLQMKLCVGITGAKLRRSAGNKLLGNWTGLNSGGQNLHINTVRDPMHSWQALWCVRFPPCFPLKTSFWHTPNLFFCRLRRLSFQSWKHLWCILLALRSCFPGTFLGVSSNFSFCFS